MGDVLCGVYVGIDLGWLIFVVYGILWFCVCEIFCVMNKFCCICCYGRF